MNKEFISFAGTIPVNYDKYLGPFLFEPYAIQLTSTIDTKAVQNILEVACGTGRVTKHLRKLFPVPASLIASDFNTGMLDLAEANLNDSSIKFLRADAQELPFDDESFDLVVCQFGFMFVPDKLKAFKEAFRVLKKNGTLVFNTWDKLETNLPALIVSNVVAEYFNNDIPNFYLLPHSMHRKDELQQLLSNCGFRETEIKFVSIDTTSPSAMDIANGFIIGTPAFNEIQAADASAPGKIIEIAAKKIEEQLGNNPVHATISAWLCKAKK